MQKTKAKNSSKTLINIGGFCRFYRKNILKLPLKVLSIESGVKISTISAFEQGKSSNINHLFIYIDIIRDNGEKLGFLQALNEVAQGGQIPPYIYNHNGGVMNGKNQ